MTDVDIRPLVPADREEWGSLWTQYLAFYETTRPQAVFDATWARLLSGGENEFKGLIARSSDGTALGITHYLFHRHCWSIDNVCYLQDLYVVPNARGLGVGRKLIEAVYAAADESGSGDVYWLTQDFNEQARVLYDRIGTLTPFIKYQRVR